LEGGGNKGGRGHRKGRDKQKGTRRGRGVQAKEDTGAGALVGLIEKETRGGGGREGGAGAGVHWRAIPNRGIEFIIVFLGNGYR